MIMKIDKLYGNAYETAINNIISIINNTLKTEFDYILDCEKFEHLAVKLNLEFDENGNLI